MPTGGSVHLNAENIQVREKSGLPLENGRYIKITVADHGAGVSPAGGEDFRSLLYDKEASSGLGLAISYSIIRKHGGFLHLENNSPAGATFAFLPAARGEVVSDPLRPNDRSLQFNHQRILVMDDESAIRELTAQLLGTMGYEVTAVPNGSEAVRIYERAARKGEHFRAVILDATVRGASGSGNDRAPAPDRPGSECHHLQRLCG